MNKHLPASLLIWLGPARPTSPSQAARPSVLVATVAGHTVSSLGLVGYRPDRG